MKIIAGKKYRARNGKVATITSTDCFGFTTAYPVYGTVGNQAHYWTAAGEYDTQGRHVLDLREEISEVSGNSAPGVNVLSDDNKVTQSPDVKAIMEIDRILQGLSVVDAQSVRGWIKERMQPDTFWSTANRKQVGGEVPPGA